MNASDSVLEREVKLTELIELESFRELMKTFADLYRIGIKVFDIEGSKLVDIRVGSSPFCGYLFGYTETRKACTQIVNGLKRDIFAKREGREFPRVVNCFSGLRYVVMPIHFEGDLLGRMVFGPYMPQQRLAPADEIYQLEPSMNRDTVVRLSRNVRQAPDDLISKVLEQLQKNIEVILFASYRSLLTTQVHLESVTTSYNEMQERNEELNKANTRLEELDKMKSNFLATVSHELRTPLTSVIGYSEMLLEGMAGTLNDEQNDFVTTIMSKGETLLALISQILDLSRIEAGSMRLHFEHIDLPKVVREASTSVVPQAHKKNIELAIDLADNLPARFNGDREKIVQIIVNLLGNAVKFTPKDGKISVAVDVHRTTLRPAKEADIDSGAFKFDLSEEDFLRIKVTDSGIGIPEDKVDNVFERFFQVDNSSTRNYGGSGLGLSIVRSFVAGHEGEILCESVVDQGTTFTVLLPLQRD